LPPARVEDFWILTPVCQSVDTRSRKARLDDDGNLAELSEDSGPGVAVAGTEGQSIAISNIRLEEDQDAIEDCG